MRTTRFRRPWFVIPMIVLLGGIVSAGLVLYKFVTRGESTKNTNRAVNTRTVSSPTCGNGICENVACQSTNCPPPETTTSCPQDCGDEVTGSTGIDANGNVNVSVSTNAPMPATLKYATAIQTPQDMKSCPIDDANLTPADAVRVAARAGLTQGTKDVTVTFARSSSPLDQCVWTVKNYLLPSSGKVVDVIDATQDILRSATWK